MRIALLGMVARRAPWEMGVRVTRPRTDEVLSIVREAASSMPEDLAQVSSGSWSRWEGGEADRAVRMRRRAGTIASSLLLHAQE